MPNSPSASKRLRQNKVHQARNKATKSAMRSQIKKVVAAARAGDIETAETEFKLATKKLDRAGAKGVIHANTAGRYKSRLSKMIKKVKDGVEL